MYYQTNNDNREKDDQASNNIIEMVFVTKMLAKWEEEDRYETYVFDDEDEWEEYDTYGDNYNEDKRKMRKTRVRDYVVSMLFITIKLFIVPCLI